MRNHRHSARFFLNSNQDIARTKASHRSLKLKSEWGSKFESEFECQTLALGSHRAFWPGLFAFHLFLAGKINKWMNERPNWMLEWTRRDETRRDETDRYCCCCCRGCLSWKQRPPSADTSRSDDSAKVVCRTNTARQFNSPNPPLSHNAYFIARLVQATQFQRFRRCFSKAEFGSLMRKRKKRNRFSTGLICNLFPFRSVRSICNHFCEGSKLENLQHTHRTT